MKKKLLLLSLSSVLLLTACGSGDDKKESSSGSEEKTEKVDKKKEKKEKSDKETLDQKVGDTIDAEGGSRTIVAQVENINETLEDGPFKVTLKHAQLSNFYPAKDYAEMFGGEELVLVTFNIKVEHTTEETDSIYPDQGIVVTNTGNQVDAETFLSDKVGGEFYGKVVKEGDVFFIYEGKAEDVSSVRYLIDSGHDENLENFGDQLEFNVDFK